jgi:hypothetical protein
MSSGDKSKNQRKKLTDGAKPRREAARRKLELSPVLRERERYMRADRRPDHRSKSRQPGRQQRKPGEEKQWPWRWRKPRRRNQVPCALLLVRPKNRYTRPKPVRRTQTVNRSNRPTQNQIEPHLMKTSRNQLKA